MSKKAKQPKATAAEVAKEAKKAKAHLLEEVSRWYDFSVAAYHWSDKTRTRYFTASIDYNGRGGIQLKTARTTHCDNPPIQVFRLRRK